MIKLTVNYAHTSDIIPKLINGNKELVGVLWAGADVLRSKMDANEYKDYILGFVFYKYLSDNFLLKVYDLIN